MEAAWEQTDEFHERWKLKARDLLANTAWRKKKITKRVGAGADPGGERCLSMGAIGWPWCDELPALSSMRVLHHHHHHLNNNHTLAASPPVSTCLLRAQIMCLRPAAAATIPLLSPPPASAHNFDSPPPQAMPPPTHHNPVQIMDEKERARAEAKEAKEAAKAAQQADKDWEETRDERVGSWRDFMNKSKKAKKMTGEFKPPKQKTNDEDKLYVQRPVGEQFRPTAGKPLPGGSKPAGK